MAHYLTETEKMIAESDDIQVVAVQALGHAAAIGDEWKIAALSRIMRAALRRISDLTPAPDTRQPMALLRDARELIAELADEDLRSACLIDKETGQPLRETMDEMCRPGIEEMEGILERIDVVLVGDGCERESVKSLFGSHHGDECTCGAFANDGAAP